MKNFATRLFGFVAAVLFVLTASVLPAKAGPSFTEVALDSDPRWEVIYEGKTYDEAANTSTFTYTVNVYDDPALSHFTVGFPLCDNLAVVGYWPEEAVSIGLDPTTGVYGIKWDTGLNPGYSQEYSVTIQGNVLEGNVQVAVKAGLFVAIGDRPGPSCDTVVSPNTYTISGYAFLDSDKDGVFDAGEAGLDHVTVYILDGDGNLVATVTTDANGYYEIVGLVEGIYQVVIPVATEIEDFNDVLLQYFTPTTPTVIDVVLAGADSTGNNFGFAPNGQKILDDIGTLPGEGRTIGFWKHQLSVAISGKGRAQVPATVVAGYIAQIQSFFLVTPFQFGGSFSGALAVLSSTSSDPVALLSKQLLATEFNEFAGLGLVGEYDYLQTVLLKWGETLVAGSSGYTGAELLQAKDVFDAINNLGH